MTNKHYAKEKLEEFKKLHQAYLEIPKEYDTKNKGSYFHYDRKINKENGGITYDNGGRELRTKGGILISRAMKLYESEFKELHEQIEEIGISNNYVKMPLNDLLANLDYITGILKNSTKENLCNSTKPFSLYSRMKGFNFYGGVENIPTEYIWELGEMVFHQTRIEEIGHACEGYTHWTCRRLDTILENMHVGYFEDKKPELGEALIREILTEKNRRYNSAEEALKVISRYKIKDKGLISIVGDLLILETKLKVKSMKANERKETFIKNYENDKTKLLNRIGLKPANSESS
jgi:hypothetical protein